MSFHIVSIDSPQCSLSCRDGQLTCKTADGERKLPLEDVASIIITSFSATIHSHLFLEAAKHGVALIICEDFKPTSLVLPANRSTDTLLTRALLKLDEKTIARLWQATIDAKCRNQLSLAEHLAPGDVALSALRAAAWGRKPHKEAICAKMFWQVFGRSMDDGEFSRDRQSGGLNSLLNYGYAVLLSTILQKLFGARARSDVWYFTRAARTQHAARLRSHGAVSAVRGLACRTVGAAAFGGGELGSDKGIPRLGDGVSARTRGVSRSHARRARVHRGCGARLSAGSALQRPKVLQAMDTEKFKMGWLIVAFDLPVGSKAQRKTAHDFREWLKDDGYQMLQWSVYARACVTFARQETHIDRVKKNLPSEGSVRAIFVTRAQWERSFVLHGSPAVEVAAEDLPEQIQLW